MFNKILSGASNTLDSISSDVSLILTPEQASVTSSQGLCCSVLMHQPLMPGWSSVGTHQCQRGGESGRMVWEARVFQPGVFKIGVLKMVSCSLIIINSEIRPAIRTPKKEIPDLDGEMRCENDLFRCPGGSGCGVRIVRGVVRKMVSFLLINY